jgi:hypothetical protein
MRTDPWELGKGHKRTDWGAGTRDLHSGGNPPACETFPQQPFDRVPVRSAPSSRDGQPGEVDSSCGTTEGMHDTECFSTHHPTKLKEAGVNEDRKAAAVRGSK